MQHKNRGKWKKAVHEETKIQVHHQKTSDQLEPLRVVQNGVIECRPSGVESNHGVLATWSDQWPVMSIRI